MMEPVRLHAEREVDFSDEPPRTEEIERNQELRVGNNCLARPDDNSAGDNQNSEAEEEEAGTSGDTQVWGGDEVPLHGDCQGQFHGEAGSWGGVDSSPSSAESGTWHAEELYRSSDEDSAAWETESETWPGESCIISYKEPTAWETESDTWAEESYIMSDKEPTAWETESETWAGEFCVISIEEPAAWKTESKTWAGKSCIMSDKEPTAWETESDTWAEESCSISDEPEAWEENPGHFSAERSAEQRESLETQVLILRELLLELLDHTTQHKEINSEGEEEEDSEAETESFFGDEEDWHAEQADIYQEHIQCLAMLLYVLDHGSLPQRPSP